MAFSLRSFLKLLDTSYGDVTLDAPQAAVIGATFGNGAATCPAPNNGSPATSRSGSPVMGESGNTGMFINNPAVSPSSTGADIVVGFIPIPAGSFDIANREIEAQLVFTHAANTNSVTYKLQVTSTLPVINSAIVGGTAIASSGAVITSGATVIMAASIAKNGAAGSNTQLAVHQANQVGATVAAPTAPTPLTLNESAVNYLAVTINAATTATDGAFSFGQFTASN